MLPADQIEALEGLVDEVERMSGVREHAIRPGCEHKLGERGRRGAGRDRGEHGALRRLPMPDGCPPPQPPAICPTTLAGGTSAASSPYTPLAMTRPRSWARPSSSRRRQCAAGSA